MRDASFLAMREETSRVAALARGAARERGLAGLLADLRLRGRDLGSARFDDQVKLCDNVAKALRAELPNLADSAITATVLDGLDEKIADAAKMLLLPRDTVGVKRAATAGLVVAFREAGRLLTEELDPLMATFAKTDAVYHERYLAARHVVDRPATRPTADDAEGETPAAPTTPTAGKEVPATAA